VFISALASGMFGVSPGAGLAAVFAATTVLVLGMWWLIRQLQRDAEVLEDAIDRFGRGEMGSRAPAPRLRESAGIAQSFNVMTERVSSATRRLAHEAFHDPLTGLPNRGYFLARLRAALEGRTGTRGQVAVLCLDLDRFKKVNDTLGHAVGDELLSVVAIRLSSTVGPDHMVARLGGDEFTVLLEETRGPVAENLASRIVDALRRSFHVAGHDLFVTVSVGMAMSDRRHGDALDLLRQADVALYSAKSRGASRYAVYQPALDSRSPEMLQLEAGLARAVSNGELLVYYQPEVDLRTGRLAGMEALVRWHHPRRGLLPPGEFIPVAEETGEIVAIGRWVLEQACRDTAALARRIPELELQVGVNVSAREFQRPDLVEQVGAILKRTGLAPHRLELEITESAVIDNLAQAIETMTALRDLGVNLAIDDFGTGYSSLSYLHQLPLTTLKIDRSFVRDIGQRETTSAVARAIVDLANALGMEVVAEGIEHRDQLDYLRLLHCDRGQGYLFSRPLPRDEFVTLAWQRAQREAQARRRAG
jgi:diguanylate cyclase (GGDEF)-like protein